MPEGVNVGDRGHAYNQGTMPTTWAKDGPVGVGVTGPWGMFWGHWRGRVGSFLEGHKGPGERLELNLAPGDHGAGQSWALGSCVCVCVCTLRMAGVWWRSQSWVLKSPKGEA